MHLLRNQIGIADQSSNRPALPLISLKKLIHYSILIVQVIHHTWLIDNLQKSVIIELYCYSASSIGLRFGPDNDAICCDFRGILIH